MIQTFVFMKLGEEVVC